MARIKWSGTVCYFCFHDVDPHNSKIIYKNTLFRCCLVFTEGFETSLWHLKHNTRRTQMHEIRESNATNPTWNLDVLHFPQSFLWLQKLCYMNAQKIFQLSSL